MNEVRRTSEVFENTVEQRKRRQLRSSPARLFGGGFRRGFIPTPQGERVVPRIGSEQVILTAARQKSIEEFQESVGMKLSSDSLKDRFLSRRLVENLESLFPSKRKGSVISRSIPIKEIQKRQVSSSRSAIRAFSPPRWLSTRAVLDVVSRLGPSSSSVVQEVLKRAYFEEQRETQPLRLAQRRTVELLGRSRLVNEVEWSESKREYSRKSKADPLDIGLRSNLEELITFFEDNKPGKIVDPQSNRGSKLIRALRGGRSQALFKSRNLRYERSVSGAQSIGNSKTNNPSTISVPRTEPTYVESQYIEDQKRQKKPELPQTSNQKKMSQKGRALRKRIAKPSLVRWHRAPHRASGVRSRTVAQPSNLTIGSRQFVEVIDAQTSQPPNDTRARVEPGRSQLTNSGVPQRTIRAFSSKAEPLFVSPSKKEPDPIVQDATPINKNQAEAPKEGYSWSASDDVIEEMMKEVERKAGKKEQKKKTKDVVRRKKESKKSVIENLDEEKLFLILQDLAKDNSEAEELIREILRKVEELEDFDRFRQI
ncbi:MAG: hypothetical protein CMK59_12435 [Proteobacteria bacterium]|nr:hypothetical protein [Pseudomonadota bacterium]